MFKVLAHRAGQHGLIVLITCHRLTPTAWPGNGLWYSKEISEAKVLESWGKMASALCDQWNVFAVVRRRKAIAKLPFGWTGAPLDAHTHNAAHTCT